MCQLCSPWNEVHGIEGTYKSNWYQELCFFFKIIYLTKHVFDYGFKVHTGDQYLTYHLLVMNTSCSSKISQKTFNEEVVCWLMKIPIFIHQTIVMQKY